MLDARETLAGRKRTPADRAAIARHARPIDANREAPPDAADRRAVEEHHSRVRAALAS